MFVIAAVFGMIGLSLMELVLSLFGAEIGLFGVRASACSPRWPAWCSVCSC